MNPARHTKFLDAEVFQLTDSAHALFTDRSHGNMSSVGGLDAEHGLQARERLRDALMVRRLVRGYQVHGTVVGRIPSDGVDPQHSPSVPALGDSDEQPTFEADGHAVAARNIAAMVLTADCIPVLLAAHGTVAALHAGWRGLAGGVLEEGVHALRELGGSGDAIALVGPCAGACCYEVGDEVHAIFGLHHSASRTIDLRAIAHQRLLAAGVAQVRDVHACTICDERFFSHRREGTLAGRQAAVAWLT